MNFQEIEKFKNIFEGLVDYVNFKNCDPKLYYKDLTFINHYINNKYIHKKEEEINKFIEYIYNVIKRYCNENNIDFDLNYFPDNLYIKYKNDVFNEKIYKIFFIVPNFANQFSIIKSSGDIDSSLIINFEDIINYFVEQNKKNNLKNIKSSIKELKKQGLTKEEIEQQIKNILYENQENTKQKVKTLQK